MAGSGIPWSSKNGVIRFGAATTSLSPTCNLVLFNSEWDVDPETDWDPTDHMDAAGFKTSVACMERAKIRVSGWMDATALMWDSGAFASPIVDGKQISAKFFLNGLASPSFIFPTLNILGTPVRARTNTAFRYEFNAETNGQWLLPTGAVPTP